MGEYAPETGEVREQYAANIARFGPGFGTNEVGRDAFDAWLAAHDAQVKAAALREAGARMDDISQKIGFETPADAVRAMMQIARRMADRIEADS